MSRNYGTHPMSLEEAIGILCRIHTRDDPQIGFCIMAGAGPCEPFCPHSPEEYTQAWETLRKRVGMAGIVNPHLDENGMIKPAGPVPDRFQP